MPIFKNQKSQIVALFQSKGFIKYFRNTSWLLVDKVVNLTIAMLVSILVARYLGPDRFGLLSFSVSVSQIFILLSKLGLESIIVRNLLSGDERNTIVLGTALGLRVLTSILCISLYTVIGIMVTSDYLTYQLILVHVVITFFASFNVIQNYFQSEVKAKYIARIAIYKIVVASILKLLLVYFEFSLIFFAFVALIESFLGAIGLIIILNKKSELNLLQWRFSRKYAISLLQDAWPLLLSSIIVFVYMQTDQIMIKYLMDNSSVGYYAVAVKLSTVWFMFATILCSSLFPAIINAKEKSEVEYQKRLKSLLHLLVISGLGISIVVSLVDTYLIEFLYGIEFMLAIKALEIQIWSTVFVFIGVAATKWFIAENLQRLLFIRTLLGAIVNILLNLILIPRYGIQGAAIATLVAQIAASFLGNLLSPLTRGLFILQLKALILR